MKNLGEIIEACKDGQKPPYEDVYYTIIALDALSAFDTRALRKLAFDPPSKSMNAEWQANESWDRWKRAYEKPPKDWVGWNNDPANPDYQKRRAVSLKLYAKAINGELKKLRKKAAECPDQHPTKEEV